MKDIIAHDVMIDTILKDVVAATSENTLASVKETTASVKVLPPLLLRILTRL